MEGNNTNASGKVTWLPYMLVIAIVLIVGVAVFMSGGGSGKQAPAKNAKNAPKDSVAADISDATLKLPENKNFKPLKVTLPHVTKTMGANSKFVYEFNLNWKEGSSTILHVIADDCLDKLTVNGKSLKINPDMQCGWRKIRDFDLKGILKAGQNAVVAEGTNNGGEGGLSVYTSK